MLLQNHLKDREIFQSVRQFDGFYNCKQKNDRKNKKGSQNKTAGLVGTIRK